MRRRRPLIVIAAEKEAEAVLRGIGHVDPPERLHPWERFAAREHSDAPVDIVLSGIGEANAAAAAACALDPDRHSMLISAGIAGALPDSGLSIGDRVAVETSVPEVGLRSPEGFLTAAEMGFPLGPFSDPGIPADPALLGRAIRVADRSGAVLTVSVCSGTDDLARERASRTGAIAEAMEGAAVGLVACRRRAPFLEIRTISNTTGDRSRQVWDLDRALDELGRFVSEVVGR